MIDGLTKQGDPLSLIKSTLTTSLGNWYLDDLATTDPGALVMTMKAHKASMNHYGWSHGWLIPVCDYADHFTEIMPRSQKVSIHIWLADSMDQNQGLCNLPSWRTHLQSPCHPLLLHKESTHRPSLNMKFHLTLVSWSSYKQRLTILGYQGNTDILTLPVEHHGLDFPSIAWMNMGLVAEGLACDLNHHIPVYQHVAHITLADWTCGI